nr:NfeD family protein [Sulfobacillus thermosulfidooxidans]
MWRVWVRTMRYRSSIDRLIGSVGIAVTVIPADRMGMGIVKVNGQQWSAVTDNPEPIPAGSKIWVSARDQITLIVVADQG